MSSVQSPDNELQRIWFSIHNQGWTSLALVPTHSSIDIAKIADTLAAIGQLQGERSIRIVDATHTQFAQVQEVIDQIGAVVSRGESAIVPVGVISENPSGIALAQATSASLLFVRLGESLLGPSQATLESIGRERFIGSVILEPSSGAFR